MPPTVIRDSLAETMPLRAVRAELMRTVSKEEGCMHLERKGVLAVSLELKGLSVDNATSCRNVGDEEGTIS